MNHNSTIVGKKEERKELDCCNNEELTAVVYNDSRGMNYHHA